MVHNKMVLWYKYIFCCYAITLWSNGDANGNIIDIDEICFKKMARNALQPMN